MKKIFQQQQQQLLQQLQQHRKILLQPLQNKQFKELFSNLLKKIMKIKLKLVCSFIFKKKQKKIFLNLLFFLKK